MSTSSIIEPAITQLVAIARDLAEQLSEAEERTRKLTEQLEDAHRTAQIRRIELGRHLLRARKQLPKRGTAENGWGAFLEASELSEATAFRYMKLAEATLDFTEFELKDKPLPTYADLGLDQREGSQQPDAPPPTDAASPPDAAPRMPDVTGEVEIDRDTWCTPKDLAEALGQWTLDPCSNERSHIQAVRAFRLDRGEDGLELAAKVKPASRVFINPPYSNVTPWIRGYAHTRFCFLLKLDPSTKWFAELYAMTSLILVPRGTRVQFEAPPGVPPDKSNANPFPHAFFLRREEDAPKSLVDRCFVWRVA